MTEDTPVYCPTISPYYFDSVDSAALAAWDDGEEPTSVEAYYCTVRGVYVPPLVDVVEEAWAEEYEDPDEHGLQIPEPLRSELTDVYNRLVEIAPIVWVPDMHRTAYLPAVDCPQCGRWSNEPVNEDAPECGFCD